MCGISTNGSRRDNLCSKSTNGNVDVSRQKYKPVLTDQRNQKTKVFSDDPTKTCKTFCCSCDQVVTLAFLRKHVEYKHQMTIKEYRQLYGNPSKQVIQLIYHKCRLCQQNILLDTDQLSKHMKKMHQYMKQGDALKTKVENDGLKKPDLDKTPLILIECDECNKTFKQNIQLRTHKKKHMTRRVSFS